MRRNQQRRRGEFSVGRLFAITTVLALLFSMGLIVGQHMLLRDGLSPAVAAGDAAPDTSPLTAEDEANEGADESLTSTIFSFYDALTSPQPAQEIDHDGGEAHSEEPLQDRPSAAAPEPGTAATQAPTPARFTLQIASHATMERARTEMDRLRRMDLDPHVIAVDADGHGEYYRVRLGKYPDEDHARAALHRLASEHSLRAFVTPL